MNKLLTSVVFASTMFVGTLFGPINLVGSIGADELPTVSAAHAAGDCSQASPKCGVYVPPSENSRGTADMELRYWVLNCHPDYNLLLSPRHWPYVMTTENGLGAMISKIMKNPQADHEGAIIVRQECRKQYYRPGWRALTVTPCRIPGKEVFMVTRPLTAADHGRQLTKGDWIQTKYMF